ncbi:glycosyltransferase family 2 protein [Collimonas antrihumi]|uniref:glycosyltransferase family 2 protein n=1 Tax=Collimonas antrihumi TaxID=1940615 RepID=UPI001FE82B64|nr:glycosyltransferase family 2 protein [Collimonas antrihumi]
MLLDKMEIEQLPRRTLSVVVPVFNEQEVLPEFHRRVGAVLDTLEMNSKFIYVNDGSTDGTVDVINGLQMRDARVTLVDLSRNFGKEIALTAGLDHTDSDAVIVIDADLQDPPELIPELVAQWLAGYDVVYAKRTCRDGEDVFKKVTAFLFYRLIQKMSRVQIPEDTGDYRLLSRRAVEAIGQLREQHRFMKGLFTWIGYPQKAVLYRRAPRFAGATKWNYWKLWNFALEGITSFTGLPLKVATYVGLASAVGAFGYGLYMILRTLIYGNPVAGYPSLLVAIMFLGGMQLLGIGIIGEYLARMFDESKHRPLYFLKTGRSVNNVRDPQPTVLRSAEAIE